ncbi:MAG: proteasome assembly chaperone family protein [DPANN group archaeon]|nr:proteasome assembly chaperone family protein [DPANN group archaeon]
MDTTEIIILKKPTLNKPIFISGLPGVGYIGRNVVAYIIDQLKAEKFAKLRSHHFPPVVLLDHDKTGKITELANEFYFYKAKKKDERDLILLIGDAQSIDSIGHYEISEKIIKLAKKLKTEELITIAGFPTGQLEDTKDCKVFGAAIKDKVIKKFEKEKIIFKDTNIGQIIGASGLLVVDAEKENIDAVCLMGETSGMLLSDPKATESVLKIIVKYLNIKIDMTKIKENVKDTEKVIKKIESIQKKMTNNASKTKTEELGYIG